MAILTNRLVNLTVAPNKFSAVISLLSNLNDAIFVTLREKDMQVTYVPNTYFFEHLADYHVLQKDIARILNKTEAAVSKDIKNILFSMLDIERIAELGSFTHGSFMMTRGGSFDHTSQLPYYQSPAYRLYNMYSDLMGIYGTQAEITKASGISEKKIKLLKRTVMDDDLGLVTDPKVLAQFRYRDFLILLSLIDNVDPWRYINDKNGWFPINDAMANTHVLASSILQYKADKEAELKASAMAAEEISAKYAESCRQIQEKDLEHKKLRKILHQEQIANADKFNQISRLKANAIHDRDIYQEFISYVNDQLDMMEKHPTEVHAFITAIRRKRKETEEALKK